MNCTHGILKQKADGGIDGYLNNLQFSNGSGSDLFAVLHAYNVWEQKRINNDFGPMDGADNLKSMKERERAWAERFNLDISGLYECDAYVKEIEYRLIRKGIQNHTGPNRVNWENHEKMTILKVVIAGKTWIFPQYSLRFYKIQHS